MDPGDMSKFFALISALVPFGVGADLILLGRIAGGVLWVSAALAALLSLDPACFKAISKMAVWMCSRFRL